VWILSDYFISRQKEQHVSLTIEVARRILEASKQRALEFRSPVSIAIVDAGGHLVLFERMMSPYGWATGNISLAKASTAVMFNQSTDAIAQWGSGIPGFASSMATMTQGKFIMAAGGWPIRMGGATIGGIGVSGGNAPGRDDEIARAGLAVVESAAPVNQSMQYSNPLPQASASQYSQQPAPAFSSMQQHQPQVDNSLNSPVPQINPLNIHNTTSDQEKPYGDDQMSFDQNNETRGDQS
jgi:uncharacterized protein GlcG (DUF336 family)